ncbi:uncharacterized protein UV8b_05751 [Ustilaginoidea virens]|uniref:Amidohydrolase 3 domain-containing protein n=1 Tax=Ustilaginoidea virens TaxID=1159556 RepID=A0A8E5HU11_USTVR|nr:uncharacterized protein UV8b_05751 [Ustilaginoidea virens]QUC21508.1 hypothetical protein UV8b_05751 [Ustilaginoidea virens]
MGGLRGMRVAAYWLMKPNGSLETVLAQVDRAAELAKQYNSKLTPDRRLVGVKVICDGTIDACTASITTRLSSAHGLAWLVKRGASERLFAYREFADEGAPLALGSDASTAPHHPLHNLYVATARRSISEPELQTAVNPEFALTVSQAVAGATHGAAHSTFADQWTGSLTAGLKADFVVCDVIVAPEEMAKGVATETWFEGKTV